MGEPFRYDVVWNQWVLLYLTDEHLVEYLKRCRAAQHENGLIVVKENVTLGMKHVFDDDDNSITRTDLQYKQIFKKAGLTLLDEMQQTSWPDDLVAVKMY